MPLIPLKLQRIVRTVDTARFWGSGRTGGGGRDKSATSESMKSSEESVSADPAPKPPQDPVGTTPDPAPPNGRGNDK
jgi:hypothetical protein